MNPPTKRFGLLDIVPGLRLLLRYDFAWLPQDLTAALVVTLVLIPSAIAYADLARCPPIAGLYAALVGMVAEALVGEMILSFKWSLRSCAKLLRSEADTWESGR